MSYTQDFFTSRNSQTPGQEKVGQEGRLWYDSETNSIRVGDGKTTGGLFVGTGSPYSLPVASATTLGGVKIDGTTIVVNPETGEISSITGDAYRLPTASSVTLGGIKVGDNLTITPDGTLNAVLYQLPIASTSTLGGVKVDGSTVFVNDQGVISSTVYTLPTASNTILGGIRIGSGLTINSEGRVSAEQYQLPVANAYTLGGVKVDNSTIKIDDSGYISYTLPVANKLRLGAVKIGSGLTVDDTGLISTDNSWVMSVNSGTGIVVSQRTGDVTISTRIASTSVLGSVRVDNSTIVADPTGRISVTTSGIVGTVKSVSVNSANGFTGEVTSASTYPSITLGTSVDGLIKGVNGVIVNAQPSVDYQLPISLTTNGTTDSSTFINNVLNIPIYQGKITLQTAGVSGKATLVDNILNIPDYGSVTSITFSSQDIAFSGTNPITRSGTVIMSLNTVPVSKGGTGRTSFTAGYLKSDGTVLSSSTNISAADVVGNISGKATNVTGVVSIENGGTGATTSKDAMIALLPSQTGNENKILSTDGGGILFWADRTETQYVSSVAVSGGTTGLTTSGGPITSRGTITLSGVLKVANGGTGASLPTDARANLEAAKSGANSDITSLSRLTTPLTIEQGGTNAKTAVEARVQLGAASRGANSDITGLSGLTTPLSVVQGGTGGANPTVARANLSAAKSGANSDITSLSGLTTPLSIDQGGTGASTAAGAINLLLPTQQGNEKKYLTTDGISAKWAFVQPAAVGLDGQLQFNNDGLLNGTERMFYDGRGLITIGNGSSELFRFVGVRAKDRFNSGTTVEIKGGDSFDLYAGQTIPPAGNVLLTGGRGIGDGAPGYISFRVGDESSEVFRINPNGSWKLGNTTGYRRQVLVAGKEPSNSSLNQPPNTQFTVPTWVDWPLAAEGKTGLIKILQPYSVSGFRFVSNPNPYDSNDIAVTDRPDQVLRAELTSVDGATIKVDGDGKISVNTDQVRIDVFPDLVPNTLLFTDGTEISWRTLSEIPGANEDTPGPVKIDNYTIRTNGSGRIYADLNAILPNQSGNYKKVLFTDGGSASWQSLDFGLPIATAGNVGVVSVDDSSIIVSRQGQIRVNPDRIMPAPPVDVGTVYLKATRTPSNPEVPFLYWGKLEIPTADINLPGLVTLDNDTIKWKTGNSGWDVIYADIFNLLPPRPTFQPGSIEAAQNRSLFLGTSPKIRGQPDVHPVNRLFWSSSPYELPLATFVTPGGIRIDNDTVTLTNSDYEYGAGILNVNSLKLTGKNGAVVYNKDGKTDTMDVLRYARTQDVIISGPNENVTVLDSFTHRLFFGESTPAKHPTTSENVAIETVTGATLTIKTSNAAGNTYSPGNIVIKGGRNLYNAPRGGHITIEGGEGDAAGSSGAHQHAGNIDIVGGLGQTRAFSDRTMTVASGGYIRFSTGIDSSVERLKITDSGEWVVGEQGYGEDGYTLLSNGAYKSPTWGVLPIRGGGTGATDKDSAINNLLPPQGELANHVLITNGYNVEWRGLTDGIIPVATKDTIGGIRLDDETVYVNGLGVLSVITGNKVGTVSSVDIDGKDTGLVFQGGPITKSGKFTLTGSLNVYHGGTGGTDRPSAINNLLPTQGFGPLLSSDEIPASGSNGRALISDGVNVSWGFPANVVAAGSSGNLIFNNNGFIDAAVNLNYTEDSFIVGKISRKSSDSERSIFGIYSPDTNNENELPSEIVIRPGRSKGEYGANGPSLYLSGGLVDGSQFSAGGSVYIDGGISTGGGPGGNIVFRTTTGSALQERFVIDNTGSWLVEGSAGSEFSVLTSMGSDSPPTWRFPTVNAGGLMGDTLPENILNSSLTNVGLLDSLDVNGKIRASGIRGTTFGTGTQLDFTTPFYNILFFESTSHKIFTGSTIENTTLRLEIKSNGAWAVSGNTGDQGTVLTSNGPAGSPTWKSQFPDYEELTATTDQTVFDTTVNTVPNKLGKSRLQVFVNGVLQREGDTKAYLVTGPNQITFNQGLQADDELSIYSFQV